MDEKEDDNKKKKYDIPISLLIVCILILGIIVYSIMYPSVMIISPDNENTVSRFPKIEIDLYHDESETQLIIRHIDGDPINWTDYRIVITNASDPSDQATISSLQGEISSGQAMVFSNKTYTSMNNISFEVGLGYDIEIYKLKENKRELLAENVTCEAGIEK